MWILLLIRIQLYSPKQYILEWLWKIRGLNGTISAFKRWCLKVPRNIHHSVKTADLERPYLYPLITFPTFCSKCHSFERGTFKPVSLGSNIQEMWWGEAQASADGSLLNPSTRWKANVLKALTSKDRHLSKRNSVRTSYKSKDRLWSFLLAIALVHEVR